MDEGRRVDGVNVTERARRSPVWLDAQRPLAQWYASALGESILCRLEATLATRLGDVFGYQGLQIGNLAPGRHLLASAGLQRRLVLDAPPVAVAPDVASAASRAARPEPARLVSPSDGASAAPRADVSADVTALPIAGGSMKAVLFFHTLDFCAEPHRALREADRVLTDDGVLVVVGFNPYSAFGVRHLLSAWRPREPWNGRFYSRGRVAEWLSVLDYRVLDSHALFVRPPINSERLLRRMARLERLEPWLGAVGGLYVVTARKQTLPMTLLRRPWRARAGIAAAGLARTAGQGERASNVTRVDFRKR